MNRFSPKHRYNQHLKKGEITPDAGQANAIEHLQSIYQSLLNNQQKGGLITRLFGAKPDPVKGLYLWGGVGTGKTLLMDIFAESIGPKRCKRIHFHRFMQSIHNEKAKIKDQQNPLKTIARQLSSRHQILCLDEFSVTDITDAMILSELLRHLFEQGVTLITTSNTQIQNLYANGLQRDRFATAIELLQKHTHELKVDIGNDYRQQYLQSNQVYHTPLNTETQQALEQTFHQLAGPYETSKKCIELCGREVATIATGSGVIWFSFSSLCQSNRSKMDYIELSKRFHTVLLSDIPILDEFLEDAARRLIELVDEFYDRRVNLIISAAALPHQIYQGTRLKEPFKRTMSRLQEMSSTDYLAKAHQQ